MNKFFHLTRLALLFIKADVPKSCKISIRTLRSFWQKNISVGEQTILHCITSFDRAEARIRIGDRCYIGKSHLVAAESIEIGNDVIISWGVTIVDHNSHSIKWENRKDDIHNWHKGIKNWRDVNVAPVKIENKVWIGFNATILKGVTLGEGSIVGAGSVVTKSVPSNTVVAGNPAVIVRRLS